MRLIGPKNLPRAGSRYYDKVCSQPNRSTVWLVTSVLSFFHWFLLSLLRASIAMGRIDLQHRNSFNLIFFSSIIPIITKLFKNNIHVRSQLLNKWHIVFFCKEPIFHTEIMRNFKLVKVKKNTLREPNNCKKVNYCYFLGSNTIL